MKAKTFIRENTILISAYYKALDIGDFRVAEDIQEALVDAITAGTEKVLDAGERAGTRASIYRAIRQWASPINNRGIRRI